MEKWLQVLVIVKITPTRYFVQLSIHPRLHNVPSLGLSFLKKKKKKLKALLIHSLVNNGDTEVAVQQFSHTQMLTFLLNSHTFASLCFHKDWKLTLSRNFRGRELSI